jgi:hypothetical protein
MPQSNSYTSNRVLASLAEADLNSLLPDLQFIDLPQEMVLFDPGGVIGRIIGHRRGPHSQARRPERRVSQHPRKT